MPDPVAGLPFAWGGPIGSGRIRLLPEDFLVVEETGLEPDDRGEHLLITLEKRGLNTHEVARRIARLAGVEAGAVSWAGRKDRNAVTVQTFSLPLSRNREPDLAGLEDDNIRLLARRRHSRALRPGDLAGNRFRLRIRSFQGGIRELEARLQCIARGGVPNYFGSQRFGNQGVNLERAGALFRGETGRVSRGERGILLSTVRSLLFNRVLAKRVEQKNWNRMLPGELLQLAGSGVLTPVFDQEDARQRVESGRAHPTGPLWGGRSAVPEPRGVAAEIEAAALVDEGFWKQGLEKMGLRKDRRALRCPVERLEWSLEGDDLLLAFRLGAGCYATSVLREVVEVGGM
jgi:tRNA pseudouridine13 synthase